jgi:hypothetical protein
LCSFEHDQYPSHNVDHGVQLLNTLMMVLVSLEVLIGLRNTPPHVKKYVMEPNVFLGYLEKGNARSLNIPCHKHYPFDSLD